MKKSISYGVLGFVMLASATMPLAASAQTSTATMPILYNQASQPVNVGNASPLAAGTYYLATGGQQPVSYYGNGTFYNAATGMYGGSAVNDPNGTAGVSLGYSTTVTDPGSVVSPIASPGAPNTGSGGEALATWVTLALAATAFAIGTVYLVKQPLAYERK